MARLPPVTDRPDRRDPNETNGTNETSETSELDLGWRALAGSLEEPDFTPPIADPLPTPKRPATQPPSSPAPPAPPVPRAREFSAGLTTTLLFAITAVMLISAGFTTRLDDKAIISPGGTFDVEEFVVVTDHPDYPSEASISLVSVRTSFAPNLFEVLGGWLDGALEVADLVDILGERTVAENREAGRLQMDQSTEIAVAVALEHLGHDIMSPVGARILNIRNDSPAEGSLEVGDLVTAVGELPILEASQLSEVIGSSEPGETVELAVQSPDGETRTVTVTLVDIEGTARLGVIVTTHVQFAELPIDVRLDVANIGGPSAGLAFTLSVIDALTPEPLTGELDVAATGTIFWDGSVGPVGGVSQKAHSVVRSGIDLLLVPASQVEQAAEVAAPAVTVVGVETLADALAAIEAHQP